MKIFTAKRLLIGGLVMVLVLVLVYISPVILMFLIDSEEIDRDMSNYGIHRQALNHAAEFMPELDMLTNARELEYGYQETYKAIFRAQTMALTVSYAPDDYAQAKADALAGKAFLDAPIMWNDVWYHSSSHNNDFVLDDAFACSGYEFRVVSYENCRYFGLLGVNDAECSIAWLFYADQDRDLIARADEDPDAAMQAILDKEFAWLDAAE